MTSLYLDHAGDRRRRSSDSQCDQTRLPGCRDTAALVWRFLALSERNGLPGYELAVFGGLSLSGEVEIIPGLEILSYERAVARGLVRNEPTYPEEPTPDYVDMGALVSVREMTWGPGLVVPRKASSCLVAARDPLGLVLTVAGVISEMVPRGPKRVSAYSYEAFVVQRDGGGAVRTEPGSSEQSSTIDANAGII